MTDLSPEAQDILRKARGAFSPADERLGAVRAALASQIAAVPAPTSSTSIPSPASGLHLPVLGAAGWTTGHTIVAALLFGALGAGGFAGWRAGIARSTPTAVAALAARAPARTGDTEMPVLAPRVTDEPRVQDSVPSAAPFELSPETPPRSRAAELRSAPNSARSAGKSRSKPEAPRDSTIEPAPVAVQGTAVEPSDTLPEEVRMLREARASLDRGEPARALTALDAHETRFPRGTLVEERLATRVQALCALGRVDGARLAAEELERVAPRSPHLGRVRASCIAPTAP